MANDTDGSKYQSLINNAKLHTHTRTPLTRALQFLATHVGAGLTTESTAAVGYWDRTLFVAKLGRVSAPDDYVAEIERLLQAPLDDPAEEALSGLNDGGQFPVTSVVGVGGGQTGLHAEMMLIKRLNQGGGVSAWGANFFYGVAIAASQGACPACAGFMNLKNIWHTGVRPNGRCSSRWINPVDGTICGSEVGLGLSFNDVQVDANYAWAANW